MFGWFKKKASADKEETKTVSPSSSDAKGKENGDEERLFSVDEPTLAAYGRITRRDHCHCMDTRSKKGKLAIPAIHAELQAEADAWSRTVSYIAEIARSQGKLFEPSAQMPWEEWMKMITLPADIEMLSKVEEIRLYGSHLRRIPPEIGEMTALRNLDIYTSYSLHWLPYELTRCTNLVDSRMSTRTLYGNRKTRLPFPRLSAPIDTLLPKTCSVCDGSFGERTPHLFWTTQRLGTDTMPLLVHSCSSECTKSIPSAPEGYFQRPHKGGGGVGMPDADLEPY